MSREVMSFYLQLELSFFKWNNAILKRKGNETFLTQTQFGILNRRINKFFFFEIFSEWPWLWFYYKYEHVIKRRNGWLKEDSWLYYISWAATKALLQSPYVSFPALSLGPFLNHVNFNSPPPHHFVLMTSLKFVYKPNRFTPKSY